MTTNPITPKDVLQEMVSIAQDNPDFVYIDQGAHAPATLSVNCSYLGRAVGDPTGSACIVGRALSNLGVSDETLKSYENIPAGGMIPSLVSASSLSDVKMINIIDGIQEDQDAGMSWGDAIKCRKDIINSYTD